MVNIQKSGDSAIKFTFTDNDRYLYDGEITVPLNSLILVLDESDMVVIKKVDGDVFLTFLIGNSNFSSKADLESWFKENACGSTGGGGVTSGDVETMISEATSGLAQSSAVTQEINAAVSGKMDTSVFNTYSASTDARLSEDEEVTSAALNELNDALDDKADTSAVTESINAAVSGKADTSAVTASITAAVSGKQDTLIAGSGITIDSANTISCTVEGGGKAIEAGRGIAITTGATADTVSFNLPISATTAGTNSIQMFNTNTTNSDARNSLIVGGWNTVNSYSATIFGGGNTVGNNSTNSYILGNSNTNNGGIGGVKIIGDNNKTYSLGGGEIIIGYNNNISGGANTSGNRIFIGEGLSAKNPKEIATGKYNVSHSGSTDADKSIFSVGNGTSSAATHNAFEIRQNGDIYITSGGTDIKLQDNLGGGGLPESAFTAYTAATEARLAEDEEVTAAALNTLNTATAANTTALGGLKLVQLTQAQYDALTVKDASTLYIITSSN